MASRAWAWLHTGLNFGPLDAGVWDKFEGYWTVLPLLPTLVNATFIRLFGLKVGSLRLASLLAGFGLLAIVYYIFYELYRSRRGGLIAVFLVSTSLSFLYSSHFIRQDIYVATLGFGAIALYLAGRRRQQSVLSLLAGLLIGAAFEFHPNGAIYAPVIGALYLLDDGRHFVRRRSFWVFVFGICLGLAWYAWLHIIPYPQTYVAMMSRKSLVTHMPPIASRNPITILLGLSSMAGYLFLGTGGRILATAVIATIVLRHKWTALHVKPLVMLAVGVTTFALLIRNRVGHYVILVAPFSDIVLAGWIEQALQATGVDSPWLGRGNAVVLSAVAMSLVFTYGTVILTPPPGDMELVANRIELVMSPSDTVIGSQTYWFGLYQYNYQSWHQILRYQWFNPGSTFEEAMKALRPDVLVMDVYWRSFTVEGPQHSPRSGLPPGDWDRGLSNEEVKSFLTRYGRLEDRFYTASYGTVEIYSLHWDRQDVGFVDADKRPDAEPAIRKEMSRWR